MSQKRIDDAVVLPVKLIYDVAEHTFHLACHTVDHEWIGTPIPRWQIKKGEILTELFRHLRDVHTANADGPYDVPL